jgi:TPR repeat protein
LITEDDLRAAADTIDEASEAELQRKLDKLKEAANARTELEVLRQQGELDSLELDQAAYQLAGQAVEDGDLTSAARWYRVAAMNDFADSPLKLAQVLGTLADECLAKPKSRVTSRDEMNLVSEAARWYASAYAAGDFEAANLLDELIARHDPTRPRACATPAGALDEMDLVADSDSNPDEDARTGPDSDSGAGIDPDVDMCEHGRV